MDIRASEGDRGLELKHQREWAGRRACSRSGCDPVVRVCEGHGVMEEMLGLGGLGRRCDSGWASRDTL